MSEADGGSVSKTGLSEQEAVEELVRLGIRIAPRFRLPPLLQLETPCSLPAASVVRSLTLGAYSYLGQDCEIRSASLGRFCSIARRVVMSQAEHPLDFAITHPIAFNPKSAFAADPYFAATVRRRPSPQGGELTIGNDVWIGEGAFIRAGLKIGDGAVVAAHAVVVKDVAPYDIVGGVPARVIRRRFSDGVVDRLLASSWWMRDISAHAETIGDVEQFLAALEGEEPAPLVVRSVTCNRTGPNLYAVTAL